MPRKVQNVVIKVLRPQDCLCPRTPAPSRVCGQHVACKEQPAELMPAASAQRIVDARMAQTGGGTLHVSVAGHARQQHAAWCAGPRSDMGVSGATSTEHIGRACCFGGALIWWGNLPCHVCLQWQ